MRRHHIALAGLALSALLLLDRCYGFHVRSYVATKNTALHASPYDTWRPKRPPIGLVQRGDKCSVVEVTAKDVVAPKVSCRGQEGWISDDDAKSFDPPIVYY